MNRRYNITRLIVNTVLALFVFISAGDTLFGSSNYPSSVFAQETTLISQWLAALRDDDQSVRLEAAYNLPDIGPDTKHNVLILIEVLLENKDPDVRRYVASALGEINLEPELTVPALIQALEDEDQNVRAHALVALVQIGPPAVPKLVEFLTSRQDLAKASSANQKIDQPYAYAALALMDIGAPAVSPLLEAVRSNYSQGEGNAALFRYTSFILKEIGEPSVPTLIEFLKEDSGPNLRLLALLTLFEIGPDAREATPALAELLTGETQDFRQEAARVLAAIGPDAAPVIVNALKHEDAEIRILASDSLRYINTRDTLPDLIEALDDPNNGTTVRANVTNALANTDLGAKAAIPILVQALNDPQVAVRQEAVNALHMMTTRIGDDAKEAIPTLTAALNDSDSEVRQIAIDTLGEIGPPAQTAVPVLIELLQTPDIPNPERIINALGNIGTDDPSYINILTDIVVAGQEIKLQQAAVNSLSHIGLPAQMAAPLLMEGFEDQDIQVQEGIINGLGHIGTGDPVAIDFLSGIVLTSEHSDLQSAAAESLGFIGPAAQSAITNLEEVIRDDSNFYYVREDAAGALIKIEPSGIPDFLNAVPDQGSRIQMGLVSGLSEVSPQQNERVVPVLISVLEDPTKKVEVRTEAVRSLAQLGSEAQIGPDETEQVIELLKEGLIDSTLGIHQSAQDALIEIGGPEVVDALLQILENPEVDEEVLVIAIDTVARLGPEAWTAELEETLLEALNSQNREVQSATIPALVAIGADIENAGPVFDAVAKDYLIQNYLSINLDRLNSDITPLMAVATIESIVEAEFDNQDSFETPSQSLISSSTDFVSSEWPPFSNIRPYDMVFTVSNTLKEVFDRLEAAVRGAGLGDPKVFKTPDGFMLITKCQLLGHNVAAEEAVSCKEEVPLWEVFWELLDSGQLELDFGMFLFIVSPEQIEGTLKILPEREDPQDIVTKLYNRNNVDFPYNDNDPIEGQNFYVAIYHIKRNLNGVELRKPSEASEIEDYLKEVGLWKDIDGLWDLCKLISSSIPNRQVWTCHFE